MHAYCRALPPPTPPTSARPPACLPGCAGGEGGEVQNRVRRPKTGPRGRRLSWTHPPLAAAGRSHTGISCRAALQLEERGDIDLQPPSARQANAQNCIALHQRSFCSHAPSAHSPLLASALPSPACPLLARRCLTPPPPPPPHPLLADEHGSSALQRATTPMGAWREAFHSWAVVPLPDKGRGPLCLPVRAWLGAQQKEGVRELGWCGVRATSLPNTAGSI